MIHIKMLGFLKKIFLAGLTALSYSSPLSVIPLSCISMSNRECKVRPEIINFNNDEAVFLSF